MMSQRFTSNPKGVLSDAQVEEAARLFSALADPSRLRLLQLLMQGEQSVSSLIKATGLSQANVSKHLGILHNHRFVSRRKEGNFAIYRVCDPTVDKLCDLMCRRMGIEAERWARLTE